MVTLGYKTMAFDPEIELDRVAYYDECKHRADGKCISTLSKEFAAAHGYGGVYGITEPFTNMVVYVGRSINIAQRFQTHLRAHSSPSDGPCIRRKNHFIKSVLASGRKPGLVPFDFDDSAASEYRYLKMIVPIYNIEGSRLDFNDSDTVLVKKIARWYQSYGQDSKLHGYTPIPYDQLWAGFRRYCLTY